MKPKIPIHHPAFVYVDSCSTDIAKTFARVRRKMAAQERAREEQQRVVTPITKRNRA